VHRRAIIRLMIKPLGSLSFLAPTLLLAGCASSGARAPVAAPASTDRPSIARPTTQRAEGVTGRTAASLITLLGQPALDVQEGNGRKLQFSGGNCVLDAYLYPQQRGEPVVTHIDARLPDGRDADRTACVAALRRR
jgi:hypothetical protein